MPGPAQVSGHRFTVDSAGPAAGQARDRTRRYRPYVSSTAAGPVLRTVDGQRLHTRLVTGPASSGLLVVLAPGFSGSWWKPYVRRIAAALAAGADVLALDLRGHGHSTGHSTLGDLEVLDVAAGVRWARAEGYPRVASVGFSMGATAALRQAVLLGGVNAVVSVSAPADWSPPTPRWIRWTTQTRPGRLFSRLLLGTRVSGYRYPGRRWPTATRDTVGHLPPTPLLIIHGARDRYFPPEHARSLAAAYAAGADGGRPARLWLEPAMGHAEAGLPVPVLDRLAAALPELAGGGRTPG